ncbi:MAG: hypothetical protein AB1797_07650 [bacterium]
MTRIKRYGILGVFFFVFLLMGSGLILYFARQPRIGGEQVTQKPTTQSLLSPTSNYSTDTELPTFRDLFKPTSQKEPDSKPVMSNNQPLLHSDSSLLLVGVLSSNPPLAILEDPSTKASYIVKKGDMVNEEEVVTIKENSVIMRKNEKRVILRLWNE